MLIRFAVENFRSLRDRQELSVVAASGNELSDLLIQVPGFPNRLLSVAAIYGANASGKSNVLKAIAFFLATIRDSQRSWKPDESIPVDPFLLDETKEKPSVFEMDFLHDEQHYTYGFSLNSSQILREWLYTYPNVKRQVLFERDSSDDHGIKFGKNLTGQNRTIETLTRKNSLFLSAAAQNNHEMLSPIFAALTTRVRFLFGPRTDINPWLAQKCESPKLQETLVRLLSAADLGIIGLDLRREPMDEEVRIAFVNLVKTLASKYGGPAGEPPAIDKETYKLFLRHKAKGESGLALSNENESSGTLAYLALLGPALDVLTEGGLLCVDELDSSLHPHLALEIVDLFHDRKRNPHNAQLVFNTHDVNLLDASVLRRDEVWLTEKDSEGGTHLYSVNDFKPRKHENLKRGYLQGRYGAVPFLGTLDFLDLPE